METQVSELLTTAEVAAMFRVNPSTVRRWRLDGVGPGYVKVGTVYRYPRAAIDTWVGSCTRHAEAS